MLPSPSRPTANETGRFLAVPRAFRSGRRVQVDTNRDCLSVNVLFVSLLEGSFFIATPRHLARH